MKDTTSRVLAVLALVASLVVLVLASLNTVAPVQDPIARGSCSTPICFEPGGKQLDVRSGATISFSAGSVLAIDAGATQSILTPSLSVVGNLAAVGDISGATLASTGNLTVTGAGSVATALTVGGGYGSTGCTFSTAGVLQCNGAATIDGAGSFGGAVTFSGQNVYSSINVTPTDATLPLTPTARVVTLVPAGNIGLAMAPCTTGQETILYNSANFTVVITDTGNGILAGNQSIGQFDALHLVCIATKWVQVAAVSAN